MKQDAKNQKRKKKKSNKEPCRKEDRIKREGGKKEKEHATLVFPLLTVWETGARR